MPSWVATEHARSEATKIGAFSARPLRGGGEFFHEGEIFFDMTSGLGDLDETFVAGVQHFGEVENIFVTHGVCYHWCAIVISLTGMTAETLQRETAQPGVHAFMQQALHFFTFRFSRGTSLGRFEPHDVGHQ